MAILTNLLAKAQWNNADVEEVESVQPNFSKQMEDATNMNDAAEKKLPTVTLVSVSITVKRDVAAVAQNAMIADFLAGTARAWKVYENATKYYTATSYIESMTPGMNAKGLQTLTFTISGTSNGTAPSYN